MKWTDFAIPVILSIISGLFSYFASISKLKAENKKLEQLYKHDIDKLELAHKHELETLKEQAKLNKQQLEESNNDKLTSELMLKMLDMVPKNEINKLFRQSNK